MHVAIKLTLNCTWFQGALRHRIRYPRPRGGTQTCMYTHRQTHANTCKHFSHHLTVNLLIKGGNCSGGNTNMVCCVIKVCVFVQQAPVPRVLIIQLSGAMCPLIPAGSSRSLCHLTLDTVCMHLFVCMSRVYAIFNSLHVHSMPYESYTVLLYIHFCRACMITTHHLSTPVNQCSHFLLRFQTFLLQSW